MLDPPMAFWTPGFESMWWYVLCVLGWVHLRTCIASAQCLLVSLIGFVQDLPQLDAFLRGKVVVFTALDVYAVVVDLSYLYVMKWCYIIQNRWQLTSSDWNLVVSHSICYCCRYVRKHYVVVGMGRYKQTCFKLSNEEGSFSHHVSFSYLGDWITKNVLWSGHLPLKKYLSSIFLWLVSS